MSDYRQYYGLHAPILPEGMDNSTLQAGAMGLMIGGAAGAAKNLHEYKKGEKNSKQAVGDTLRLALFAGTAAAMADVVASNTGRSGILPALAALTTGTAVMYMLTKSKSEGEDK